MVPQHHKTSGVSFAGAKQGHAWFEIRVIYVRLSSCLVKCAPDCFTIVFPARSLSASLHINGAKITHSEKTSKSLRRDRIDQDSAEATYVTTDNLRAKADLPFQIHHKGEVLVTGIFLRSDSWSAGPVVDNRPCSLTRRKKLWIMECGSAVSAGSWFISTKTDHVSSPSVPFLEVYVAGRSLGQPIVLNQIVQLLPRRKNIRCISLDAIPEDGDEIGNTTNLQSQMDSKSYGHGLEGFYCNEGLDVEGELSWFNAGVRVGMGIGLGVCLGVGVGVGIIMRAYQATARHLL